MDRHREGDPTPFRMPHDVMAALDALHVPSEALKNPYQLPAGYPLGAPSHYGTTSYWRRNASNSCSSMIFVPYCCAFWSLEPGPSPATRTLVLRVTLSPVWAPSARSFASAWERGMEASAPVITKLWPTSGPLGGAFRSCVMLTPARLSFSMILRWRPPRKYASTLSPLPPPI